MTTVTFVFPRVLKDIYYEGCDYHLGAGYIRAYLAQHNITTRQYTDAGEHSIGTVATNILKSSPDFIGFSCYDANYFYVKLIAEEIKRRKYNGTIVCGGPTATFSGNLILSDCSAVDIIVEGYGEEATLDLIRWKRGQRRLAEISGIRFRDGAAVIHHTGQRKLKSLAPPKPQISPSMSGAATKREAVYIEPRIGLDDYPDPYVTGFIPPERASDIGIVTSRGCAFACTFCNFAAMSGRKVLFQSLDKVMEVFAFLDQSFKNKIGKKILVTINDDNFTMHGKRFHEILDRMAKRKFQHTKFWAEMRVEPLEKRSFAMLKRAGFYEINFGLESAVPHVLAAVKKVRSHGWVDDNYAKERDYTAKIKWAVANLRKVGIKTCVSAIFGSPSETLKDGLETVRYVDDLKVDRYAHNYITVRLGTELADTYERHGIKLSTVPGRALPLITSPSYDVRSVPILAHDESQLPIRNVFLEDAIFLTSGTSHFTETTIRPKDHGRGGSGRLVSYVDAKQSPPPAIAIIESEIAVSATAAWLASEKPMASMLWLLRERTKTDISDLEAVFADTGVPSLEFHTISALTERGERKTAFSVGGMLTEGNRGTLHLETLPLSDCCSGKALRDTSSVGPAIQFTINDQADLIALAGITSVNRLRVPYAYFSRKASIQDGCRWSSKTCPARTGDRLFVRGQTLHPCLNGGVIGAIGMGLQSIRKTATAIFERETSQRDCAKCIAQAYCSQCMFTEPFDTATFCDIQRNNRGLGLLLDGITLGRALLNEESDPLPFDNFILQSLLKLDNLVEVRGQAVPLASCLLFFAERLDYAYLHSPRYGLLAKLTRTQRLAIENLL
jgi:radical SAM superfamily enzyme YgiQ (UPF0313 family)